MGKSQLKLRDWIAVCVLLAVPLIASAQEFIDAEAPVPDSVEGLAGPIVVAFPTAEPPSVALLGNFSDYLNQFHPFIADTKMDTNFRTYYFYRDNGTPSIIEENEAWAGGGTIDMESGKLWDAVSIGAEYFLSAPISASDNKPGSGLLKPAQSTISLLGQAYARATLGEQIFTLGRQRINKPYLNQNDSRMLPNTFEAITLDGRWNHGRFYAGYIDKIKERSSDKFISMSRRAGVANSDEGLWELGARYDWGDGNFIGMLASYVPDVMSTLYSEIDTRWSSGDWGFRLGAQFTDQRSVGDDLLTGSSFDTQSVGGRMAISKSNVILTAVIKYNGDGARIRTPYGGDPSFTALMLSDFKLANQLTYKVGLAYTATSFGLPGISGFMNYARGINAEVAETGAAIPDNDEFDVTMDFRPIKGVFGEGFLGGAWLRVRYGVLNPGKDRERTNIRVTFNWGLPLL